MKKANASNSKPIADQSLTMQAIASYPLEAQQALLKLRKQILTLAKQENLGEVEEALKWGEPSFKTPKGSPIRMDWKPKYPSTVSLFFNCNSALVSTFRELFPSSFEFEGKRELRLPLQAVWPEAELNQCLVMALNYHRLKHLPLLGA